MLWLAGLVGIVGAGAASLLLPDPPPDEEQDDFPDQAADLQEHGNLLFLTEEPEMSDDNPTEFPRDDQYFSDLHDAFSFDEEHPATAEANAMLRSIVADPFGSEFIFDSAEEEMVGAADATPPLWDWIAQGKPSEVFDYHAETESLMVVWDDLEDGAEEPDISVEQDPFDADVMHVLMNGKSIAEVYGDPELSAADVTVIPLSSALIVGLESA